MAIRQLTPQEVGNLGFDAAPSPAPASTVRELSPEEVSSMGLEGPRPFTFEATGISARPPTFGEIVKRDTNKLVERVGEIPFIKRIREIESAPIPPGSRVRVDPQHIQDARNIANYQGPGESVMPLMAGLVQGENQLGKSVGTGLDIAGQLTGLEGVRNYGLDVYDYSQQLADAGQAPEKLRVSPWDDPKILLNPDWWMFNTGSMAPALGTAFIGAGGSAKALHYVAARSSMNPVTAAKLAHLGSSIMGGTVGGGLEGTSTYREMVEQGYSNEEALQGAALMTGLSAALNSYSLTKMTTPAGGGKTLKMALDAGREGGTEWAEEYAELLAKALATGEIPTGEDWQQAHRAGASVFGPAALMGGAGGVSAPELNAPPSVVDPTFREAVEGFTTPDAQGNFRRFKDLPKSDAPPLGDAAFGPWPAAVETPAPATAEEYIEAHPEIYTDAGINLGRPAQTPADVRPHTPEEAVEAVKAAQTERAEQIRQEEMPTVSERVTGYKSAFDSAIEAGQHERAQSMFTSIKELANARPDDEQIIDVENHMASVMQGFREGVAPAPEQAPGAPIEEEIPEQVVSPPEQVEEPVAATEMPDIQAQEAHKRVELVEGVDYVTRVGKIVPTRGGIKAEHVSGPPASQESAEKAPKHKVGDEQEVGGMDAIVANVETIDGVDYELYNARKLKDGRGAIRVYDTDSGNTVSIKVFPTYDAAEAEWKEAVRLAKPAEVAGDISTFIADREAEIAEATSMIEQGAEVETEDVSPPAPETDLLGEPAPSLQKSDKPPTKSVDSEGKEWSFQTALIEFDDIEVDRETFQPRKQERKASTAWIERTARTLDPNILTLDQDVAQGIPIVDETGQIIAGFHRYDAIGRAIRDYPERLDAYKEHVESLGYDTEGYNQPILVRVPEGGQDLVELSRASNVSPTQAYSSAEQAQLDAKAISWNMVTALQAETGNLSDSLMAAKNISAVRGIIDAITSTGDLGTFMTAQGGLSTQGLDRILKGVMSKVYGKRLSDAFIDSRDKHIRNVRTAIENSLADMAKITAQVESGGLPSEVDITDDIAAVAEKLHRLSVAGEKVEDYLAQGELLEEELTPFQKQMLRDFDARRRSSAKMTAMIRDYTKLVRENVSAVGQGELLPNGIDPKGLWSSATTESDLFDAPAKRSPSEEGPLKAHEEEGASEEPEETGGPSTIAELTQELDKTLGDKGQRGSVAVGRKREAQHARIDDTVKGVDSPDGFFHSRDPDVDARVRKARKGIIGPTFMEKLADFGSKAWRRATSDFEHLPNTKEYAQTRHLLHQLEKQRGVADDTAVRLLKALVRNFGRKKLDLLAWKILLDDLAYEAEQGHDLPFGYTEEAVTDDLNAVDALLEENPDVATAIVERKEALWKPLRETYINAMEAAGFNVKDRFKNPNYFHHQVLEHASKKQDGAKGAGTRLGTPTQRGFLKKRRGSTWDINANYIEAEFEVISQMLHDIKIAEVIAHIDKTHNIADDLKAKAKEEGVDDWRDLVVSPKMALWQPREGNVFYLATAIPEKFAEALRDGAVESIGIDAGMLRTLLAMGSKYKEFVIPQELADTLNNFEPGATPGWKWHADAIRAWKQWQTISPRRIGRFNARNLSGDADKMFLGNPRAFKKLPRAVIELAPIFFSKKTPMGDLAEWVKQGGIQSVYRAQEVGDIREIAAANKLLSYAEKVGGVKAAATLPVKALHAYWKGARLLTDYREAWLRYAAFLDYLEQLEKGDGIPKNYGASVKEYIDGLDTNYDKAFALSNDLLGAYDRVSVTGKDISTHIFPFWRFQEINLRTYMQTIKNAGLLTDEAGKQQGESLEENIDEEAARKMLARAGIVVTGKVVKKGIGTGARIVGVAIRMSALWAATQLWNNAMFPDEEDELPKHIRERPHIVWGRDDETGEVQYFSRIGTLGDALEWFGLDAGPNLIDDWFRGRVTAREVLVEMAKAPARKVVGGVIPLVKMSAELLTKYTVWPDPFNPRPIRDRAGHLATGFAVGPEYRALAGKPGPPYLKTLEELYSYKLEPGRGAYMDTQNLKYEFLNDRGKGFVAFHRSPKAIALYNYKMSIRYKRPELADKFEKEYYEHGGSIVGKWKSLMGLNPLANMSAQDRVEFKKSLDKEQSKRLTQAIAYWRTHLRPSAVDKKAGEKGSQ